MRFRFIEDHRDEHPIRLMCRMLEVSPSGYHAWRGRPESARSAANRVLLADIRRLHAQHRGRYGSPRIHRALPDPSERCRQSRQGCPACQGQHRQPRPDRAPDAPARYPRRRRATLPPRHHRQPPRPACCPRPVGAGLSCIWAEPGLASRHHLHTYGRGLALLGCDARPGDSQGGRLGNARAPTRRAGVCGPAHGHPTAAADQGSHHSFRSR